MLIDVLVNSCARPELLDVSINTFRDKIISNQHDFRYVLVEDKVDDKKRQEKGAEWIEKNKHSFDEVVFLEKKAGPGFWYAPTIALCKSLYHIHLEDDNKFIKRVNIDPIIELLQWSPEIVEVIFSRGKLNDKLNPRSVTIGKLRLTEMDQYSVATGIFNTTLVKNLINTIGLDKQMHEAKTLTPTSKNFGFRKFVLGHDDKHYIHVGGEKGYRKGSWK